MQLSDLYKEDYNLSKLCAMHQYTWTNGQVFNMVNPRPTNAFLYITDARVTVNTKNGERIDASVGDIVFIPMGAQYSITFFSYGSEKAKTDLLEFIVHVSESEIQLKKEFIVITPSDFKTQYLLLEQAIDEISKPFPTPATVKMLAYQVISAVVSEYVNVKIAASEYRTILSGIKYLESDPSQKLSIEEIAKMCFVSSSYFERLFKKYSGITPSKYRLKRKIERAKLLLKNPSLTLDAIAEELNFFDSAHLCRSFKNETSLTPSEYRKTVF